MLYRTSTWLVLVKIERVNVLSPSEKPVSQLESKGSTYKVNLALSITTTFGKAIFNVTVNPKFMADFKDKILHKP